MQLPVIPSFTPGETSVQHLQQLSAAVAFATVATSYPMWRFYKSAVQGITAGSWVTVQFGTGVGIDTDGVGLPNSTFATIQTQGYYCTEACLPFEGASSSNNCQGSFLFTAGPNNPHYSSGSTVRYGGIATGASASTGIDFTRTMAGHCPAVCFPGDSIAVQVFLLVNTSLNVMSNSSATAGWFPPSFAGRWVRMGS